MANTSAEMDRFVQYYPNADAKAAKALNDTARSIMFASRPNDGLFELYGQGSAEIIAKRYLHRPAQPPGELEDVPGIPGPNGTDRTQRCSICKRKFTEFARHNAEVHAQDPVSAFFCPEPGCTKVLYRPESSPIDEHLARHQKFPNSRRPGSRAYEFLHSTKKTVLKKLTAATLRHLAGEDRKKVGALGTRKADLLPKLPTDLDERFAIEELTIPGGLVDGKQPVLGSMRNAALVKHIIRLRQTIQEWEDAFTEAEGFLAIAGRT